MLARMPVREVGGGPPPPSVLRLESNHLISASWHACPRRCCNASLHMLWHTQALSRGEGVIVHGRFEMLRRHKYRCGVTTSQACQGHRGDARTLHPLCDVATRDAGTGWREYRLPPDQGCECSEGSI